MKTPVLLIAHRRPHETSLVLKAILSASPESVYVAIDGPRADVPTDADSRARVEEILRTATWPGRVDYMVGAENVGARRMVPSAIEWAMGEAQQLIILEDDCLASLSFFAFCEELLERYRDEPRVMMVAGTNPAPWRRAGPSYRFSSYGTMWGWATWAPTWRHFWEARKLLSDQTTDLRALAERAWGDPAEQRFWSDMCQRLRDGESAGWDYEWTLALALNAGLAAMPRTNLITNIGFGEDATDTFTGYADPIGRLRRGRIKFPLIDPGRLEADEHLDAVLRAGHLELGVPGLRGRIRGLLAKVRGKIDATLKRNEFSH